MFEENLDYVHSHPEIYFRQEARKGGYVCPVCGNGSGKDGTGVKLVKGQTFRYKCFKCGTSGDVINFYATERNISNAEALLGIFTLYGLGFDMPPSEQIKASKGYPRISATPQNFVSEEAEFAETLKIADIIAEDIATASENLAKTDYFEKRGISRSTAEKYNCGYLTKWVHPKRRSETKVYPSKRVIIPTGKESYVARAVDDNNALPKMKAGETQLFNVEVLETSEQNVVVVEGEFDALSVIEAGNDAIALGSASNVGKLIRLLQEKKIRPKKPLILNLDEDEAGKNATFQLSMALKEMRIRFHAINLIVEGCKDQNESLIKFREVFLKKVAEIPAKAEQLQRQARYRLNDFGKIDAWESSVRTKRKAIPTGWTSLDEILDGGLYEGLYVIPGTPGSGKSAFALQMAFQIAQQNKDVLYVSMEMGEEEIYERHLSRISHQLFWYDQTNRYKVKTVHSMVQEGETVAAAREIFKKVAPHLRTECSIGTLGAEDLRQLVENYEYEIAALPVVFVDYLQILRSPDPHMTDKQAVDYNVFRIKQLSRDFKIPVIALSSMNRTSYADVINMASLKESGGIEYTADVCLGLQHADMTKVKAKTSTGKAEKTLRQMKSQFERDMEIVVLKNRNGQVGEDVAFKYYAMFHNFTDYPRHGSARNFPQPFSDSDPPESVKFV